MLELKIRDIRLGAHATSKAQAIEEVGQLLAENGRIDPRYIRSMLEREAKADTYLGCGIAIPHGLPDDRHLIHETGIAVVQIPEGVPWQGGEASRLVVGIAARGDEHLEILSRLTGLLRQQDLVGRLSKTRDADEIVQVLGSVRRATPPVVATLEGALRRRARVAPAHGLHARPATAVAAKAREFESELRLRMGEREVDARSMAALLELGAAHGAELELLARGRDAEAALEALAALLESPDVEERSRVRAGHGWRPTATDKSLTGIPAAPGLAVGRLRFLAEIATAPRNEKGAGSPEQERNRLEEAFAQAASALRELHGTVGARASKSAAAIFLAHLELLESGGMREDALARVRAGDAAEAAWEGAFRALWTSLASSDNAVTASRAADVRDVGGRVLALLRGEGPAAAVPEDDEPVVLVARELVPSQAAQLDSTRVAGFCTVEGGATSHVAVLARSLGIPAVTGLPEAVLSLRPGAQAVLDADAGMLLVDPDGRDLETARMAVGNLHDDRRRSWESRFEPALTRDGRRIEVGANIGRVEEAAQAVEAGAEGVGLVRSEFLFLDRNEAPGEDEQFEAYRGMLRGLGGLPMILRTLDIGGDKQAPYIHEPPEENPFLGVRGIRLCLRRTDLLRTQLRAAYRAAFEGPLRLMFPMVASIGELRRAREIAEGIRVELGAPTVPIGVMIEVPTAALLAGVLAREADFFSIGTNDLTQYALAMDRGNPRLAAEAKGTHPGVLRLVAETVAGARRHGRRVGVCGGIACEPAGALLLAGLGVDELSMAIPDVARVKELLRDQDHARLREVARRALEREDADDVAALLAEEGLLPGGEP